MKSILVFCGLLLCGLCGSAQKAFISCQHVPGHTVSSQSDQQTARIFGAVTDKDFKPLQNVEIQVSKKCKCSECPDPEKCKCCPGQFTVRSTEGGRFDFKVSPGTYYLSVGETKIEVQVGPGEEKGVNIVVGRSSSSVVAG